MPPRLFWPVLPLTLTAGGTEWGKRVDGGNDSTII